MLDALRRGAKTWVAKALLAVLIASFAIWGVSDVITNVGNDTSVAVVGDTEIEAAQFQQIYTRQLQALTRQFGQAISPETAASFGLPQRVLGQMMADAALTDTAQALDIGISDEALAQAIADDPTLRPEGATSFNRGYFNQLLRDSGLTEQQYIAERRLVSGREQVTEGLVGGVTTPTALLEVLNLYLNDIRTVEYIVLAPSAAGEPPAPTDEQLVTWYADNKANFQAPEYRTVEVLSVTPDAIADPSTVGDATARAEYDRTRASFGVAEKRRVQQILFPTIDEARAAAEAIAGGKTFEAVAAERGLQPDDVDLGLIEKSGIIDPAIAEAAFTLPEGAVSEPIAARFGGALVRVAEIAPESVQPFEAVSDEIRRGIAVREAEATVLDTYDEIEDARAGGATLQEISERFNLPIRSVEVDAVGGTPAGGAVTDLPSQDQLLQAAFESETGVDNDPIQVGRRGYAWYDVVKVTPSRDRELSEVRDAVLAAWTEATLQDMLVARADAIAEAVRGGQALAEAAGDLGVEVRTAENLTRNTQNAELDPAAIAAAYEGPEGLVTTTEAPGGGRIVMKVTDTIQTPFFAEAADTIQAAERFGDEIEQGLLDLYVSDLQGTLGATINERVLQNAIGLTSR